VPPIIVNDKLSFIDFIHACDSIRDLRPQLEVVEPTDAHRVIAELEADHEVVVITLNIDNLHKRAGSTNVIELHGNVFEEYYDEDFKIERPNVVFFWRDVERRHIQSWLGCSR
jgi:NAD-dependent SIR2 family protein deacetylase